MDILELMAVLSFGLTCFGIGYSTLSEQGDTRLKYRFFGCFYSFYIILATILRYWSDFLYV